jgi:hypothetical protein
VVVAATRSTVVAEWIETIQLRSPYDADGCQVNAESETDTET